MRAKRNKTTSFKMKTRGLTMDFVDPSEWTVDSLLHRMKHWKWTKLSQDTQTWTCFPLLTNKAQCSGFRHNQYSHLCLLTVEQNHHKELNRFIKRKISFFRVSHVFFCDYNFNVRHLISNTSKFFAYGKIGTRKSVRCDLVDGYCFTLDIAVIVSFSRLNWP